MQRRVQAHQQIAARPVEFERDALAYCRQRTARGDQVGDGSRRLAFPRVRDREAFAVLADQNAGVARLTAAEWIENRAVELDLPVARRDHARCRGLEIRIVAEQQFCHLKVPFPFKGERPL